MKRRRVIGAGLVCAVVAGGALWLRGAASGGGDSDGVPTIAVAREPFVRRVSADGNLRPVQATPLVAPTTGMWGPLKVAWMVPDGSEVKAGEVVVRFDATDLEKQLRDGESDLDAANAKLRKEQIESRRSADERDSAVGLAERELSAAREFADHDESIHSRHQIIESQIDEELYNARKDHAGSAKGIENRLSRSKKELLEVEKRQAELSISQARAGLAGLEISAPHDGILVYRRDWRGEMPRVGEQVWPGHPIAELPILSDMEAEVFVLEIDGGALEEGHPAAVVVEAQPDVTYDAKVERVDKLAKPRQRGVPVQYFAVVLELERTEPEVMKPGQRVRATLTIGEAEALVAPRQAVFERDGKTVVYRRRGGEFEPVEVELGVATAGRVVIESGLEPGDVIALRDPTRTSKASGGDGDNAGEGGKAP